MDYSDIKQACSIRNVNPAELVKQALLSEEYTSNLDKLKKATEYENIKKGSTLGLTAYLKPATGIPKDDLSIDIQNLLSKIYAYLTGQATGVDSFGYVAYNEITKKINFYAANDPEMTKVIGSIDVSKLPKGLRGAKGEKGEMGPGVTLEMIDTLAEAANNALSANARATLIASTASRLLLTMSNLMEHLYPHEIMSLQLYDNLGTPSNNTIYLIYEDDI